MRFRDLFSPEEVPDEPEAFGEHIKKRKDWLWAWIIGAFLFLLVYYVAPARYLIWGGLVGGIFVLWGIYRLNIPIKVRQDSEYEIEPPEAERSEATRRWEERIKKNLRRR